jgi:TRAP-type mannitol/chloroaromatic compound transport system permease small subunit
MLLRTIRSLEQISLSSGVIAGLIILPLVASTCLEVFSRYVLGSPTSWSYELGTMGMGAHFLLGAAYALKCRAHVRIDLLYARYPVKVQALLDLLGYGLLILPFCIWLIIGFWEHTLEAWTWNERSGVSAWNPPAWPYRVVMMSGFVLLAIQVTAEILRCLAVLFGRLPSLNVDNPLRPSD